MRSKIRHKVRDYSKQIPGFRTTNARYELDRDYTQEDYIRLQLQDNTVRYARTGCLLFQGALTHDGYSKVTYKGKTTRLHKLVLETKLRRSLLPGMETLHRSKDGCYRNCINPEHLFEGSHKENMDERRKTIIRRSTSPRFHRS